VRRCMCGIYEREMKRGVDEEIAESDWENARRSDVNTQTQKLRSRNFFFVICCCCYGQNADSEERAEPPPLLLLLSHTHKHTSIQFNQRSFDFWLLTFDCGKFGFLGYAFSQNQTMKTCVGLSFLYFSLGMTKIAFVVIKIILYCRR
jgi:hypothetical protein